MKADFPQSIIDLHLKLKDNTGISYSKQMSRRMSKEDREWMLSKHLNPAKIRWMLFNGVDEIPVCPVCGKEITFEKGRTYCSNACRSSDPNVLQKIEQTNLERYGTKSAIQSDSIKEKIKQNNLEKYGSEWPLGSEMVREKIQETWQKKYGTDHPMHTKEIRQKRREACLNKFGAPSPLHSEEIRNKIKKTTLKRYGSECSLQNPDVKAKAEQTCIERYGTKCSLQNPDVKAKAEQTMVERYGSEYSFSSDVLKAKSAKTMMERYGADNPSKKESSLYDSILKARMEGIRKINYPINAAALSKIFIEIVTSEEDYPYQETIRYKCRQCGTLFESKWRNSELVRCPNCSRKNWSIKEKQLSKYISSIYSGEIVENDRSILKGKELDILVPGRNLAVEFNGTYWHSSAFKSRNYHLEKTKACTERGIRLIHVFEWEWDRSQDIVQDILAGALGCYGRTVYARSCDVREVSADEYEAFLSAYHLQGAVKSSLRLGLHLDGELLMCCGWGRSRFNSKETELHRMCAKAGTRVVGGFSKLIAHSGLNRFVSYVDVAHFTGQGYEAAGFRQIGTTPPGYRWIRNGSVLSRQQAQKSRLPRLLGEDFDPDLTEVQNMENSGWCREFDCGNLKMEWRK